MTKPTEIQKNLPNFPKEVILGWIKPAAEKNGWPPETNPKFWQEFFRGKTYEWWKSAYWSVEKMNITIINLSDGAENTLKGTNDKAKCNELENKKLDYQCSYCKKHRTCKEPIILAETKVNNVTRHEIIDGHHRILAYRLYRESYYRENNPQNINPPQDIQRFWVVKDF